METDGVPIACTDQETCECRACAADLDGSWGWLAHGHYCNYCPECGDPSPARRRELAAKSSEEGTVNQGARDANEVMHRQGVRSDLANLHRDLCEIKETLVVVVASQTETVSSVRELVAELRRLATGEYPQSDGQEEGAPAQNAPDCPEGCGPMTGIETWRLVMVGENQAKVVRRGHWDPDLNAYRLGKPVYPEASDRRCLAADDEPLDGFGCQDGCWFSLADALAAGLVIVDEETARAFDLTTGELSGEVVTPS